MVTLTGKTKQTQTRSSTSSEIIYVGIDPGSKGAIVALPPDLQMSLVFRMPLREVIMNSGKRRKEVDGYKLDEILTDLRDRYTLNVTLEHLWSRPTDTPMTAWQLACGYCRIKQALESLGLQYWLVAPTKWKSDVIGKAGYEWKGDKECSVKYIAAEYPHIPLTLGRQSKLQDGIADAACLALYGMKKRGQHG